MSSRHTDRGSPPRQPDCASGPIRELVDRVIIQGDLAVLSNEERIAYYLRVCETLGLNPLTQPFRFIVLNGELRLYALKDCTDQLRAIHGVSVEDLVESERAGVLVITAKVRNRNGRTDIAKGAVNIGNLQGEVLANALMKAETKAKRRATLSICGLGILDEGEVEDIAAVHRSQASDEPHIQPADLVPAPAGSAANGAPAAALPMPPSMAEAIARALPQETSSAEEDGAFDAQHFLALLKDRFDEAVLSGDPAAVEEVWASDQDFIEEQLGGADRERAHACYAEAQEGVLQV